MPFNDSKQYNFLFKENIDSSINDVLSHRILDKIKEDKKYNIANCDLVFYTYYDTKISSVILASKDKAPNLGKESMGCSNYAYTYNIKKNVLIDINKLFKPDNKEKLMNFLKKENTEITANKFQNGHFFVTKKGIVFVKIQATDCYYREYQGRQYFLPFSSIKDLNVLDIDYCRSVDIEIE